MNEPNAWETPPPVLRIEGLTKAYDDHTAVDHLSFEAQRGEIVGLVGPNGAGKTTTLRSIVGILPVKEGRVLVCGFDVMTHEAQAKSCLCWVPDDPQPFDALTVEEHMEFTASLYSVPDWRARSEALLERFELVEKRRALGGELSRGMRQKLALACAWLMRPRLVLLDEPLTGLDPRGIRSAKRAIAELAAEGSTVILSSHLLEMIEELASRILILDRGRKIFDGTLQHARETITGIEGGSLEEIFLKVTEAGPEAGVFGASTPQSRGPDGGGGASGP
ncbi:MAG: ABC transporter ATP-binding protein [Planctomycetota bacterium]